MVEASPPGDGSTRAAGRYRRLVGSILLAWAAYWLVGRLSLELAVPPGYATPVWPAAGVALAALLHRGAAVWPGIALGSFCLNLPVALDSQGDTAAALALAAALAAGASLQALAGRALVRRVIGTPDELPDVRRIGLLLALGGPVACLVAPTNATVAFSLLGVVGEADLAYQWFTWWVGDTIGVLAVLPVYRIWAAPRGLLSRRRKWAASVPIAVLLASVMLLFVRTSALEQARIVARFDERTDGIAATLAGRFAAYNEILHAVAAAQTATGSELDRREFAVLAHDVLARHPDLYALSWNPRVEDSQRAAFEQRMRAEGLAGFRIRDLAPGGGLEPAADRREYFPVAYIEPLGRNAKAAGFDLASEAERRRTLAQARHSGRPRATDPVQPVQVMTDQRGILLMQPAYRRAGPREAPTGSGELRGYAVALVLIEPMLTGLLRDVDAAGLDVQLVDASLPPVERVLYPEPGNGQAQRPPPGASLSRVVALEIGGRPWRLEFTAPRQAPGERSSLAWSALVVGLLATALMSSFLLVLVCQAGAVEAQVRTRTRELRASEEESRAIIATARDAYISIDDGDRIVGWNDAAQELLGWSAEEARGRHLSELVVPAGQRAGHVEGVRRYLQSGVGPVMQRRVEVNAMHRSGREVPVEVIVWSTGTGAGRRFHAFLHDIGERQRAARRLAALQTATAALVDSSALATAASRVIGAVCTELRWRFGALWMVDPASEELDCVVMWQDERAPSPAFAKACDVFRFTAGTGLPGRVWRAARPEWIPDVTRSNQFKRGAAAAQDGLRAGFAVPVNSGADVLGVLEFYSDAIEPPDEGLLSMMQAIGSLLGEFINRKRAEAALFEEKERVEVTLGSIGDGVIAVDHLARVSYLNPVAETMLGWSLAEARGQNVQDIVHIVEHESGTPGLNPLLVALRENRTLGLAVDSDLVRRDGHRSPIEDSAAPMHDRAGRVIGSVMVFHDVSESRAMALKMSHLAQHDYLTDLPNRVLLQDRFAQGLIRADRSRLKLVVLYMDVDGFKHVNDSLGHEAGDELLKAIAHRLQRAVRGIDTVSRQGGDEFVILLPDMHGSGDAAHVAEQILEAMRDPFQVTDSELNISLSIGIAVYPDDAGDPGTLLKYADAAMYQAKQQGRNRYRFYTRQIGDQADRRLLIESLLHQALRHQRFVLHYQPKVSPATGRICGMEALVRWQQEDGTLIYPGDFIAIAEECGLIAAIDAWVVEEACRQNRAWQDAGLEAVTVAVNLSATHVDLETYPAFLAGVLERTGLAPTCLQIELTESQMLHDTARFEALMQAIKALGVTIAIDDFGTGYSSLGYLHRFPFDVLKIDRSFVQSLRDGSREAAIVEAITHLARAFNYVVVAEGVETLEQVRLLDAHGCQEMQGYLYSRPLPAAQFEGLLRRGRIEAGGITSAT